MALLQDADPRDAARAALPAAVRSRRPSAITGRRVVVTIPPDGPFASLAPCSLTASWAPTRAGAEP